MAERQRLQVPLGEDRLPFFQVPHGAPDDLQRRRARRMRDRPPRARYRRDGVEAGLSCTVGPGRPQHRAQRLRLPLACRKGRLLRRRLAVDPALLLHVGQNLLSARREGLLEPPSVARDLETRDPARHRRHDRIAPLDQPPRQLVAVIRPDQPCVAVQQHGLHARPHSLRIPGHVGHDRVGVELRIEVAARDMTKQRRHHRGRLHPRPPAGGRIPAPGLQHRRLDPVEGRAHRLVMRAQHRPVAARVLLRRQQRRQRHRFRGGKSDVEARPVLVLPIPQAPEAGVRPDHVALEQLLEGSRRDSLAGFQPQRGRAAAVPRAPVLLLLRAQIRLVVPLPQVIAAFLEEILRGGGGRGQVADGGDHDRES